MKNVHLGAHVEPAPLKLLHLFLPSPSASYAADAGRLRAAGSVAGAPESVDEAAALGRFSVFGAITNEICTTQATPPQVTNYS